MKIELIKREDLIFSDNNPRIHSEKQKNMIAKSIKEFGFTNPLIIDENNRILAGHGRVLSSDLEEYPCIRINNLTEEEKNAYLILDNKIYEAGEWDIDYYDEILHENELINDFLSDVEDINTDDNTKYSDLDKSKLGGLSEKYIIPPFSLFRADSDLWLNQKRKLAELVGDNDVRGDVKHTNAQNLLKKNQKVSQLDCNLVRILTHWFCIPNGLVIDPFAGGPQGGFTISYYGFKYLGNELRREQVEFNNSVLEKNGLLTENNKYIEGDALNFYDETIKADMIFSCPPYFDLEAYSNDEKDISNMSFEAFLHLLSISFTNCYRMLKDNSFCCVVLGDVRDKKGFYRNLIHHFPVLMEKIGFKLYNECILCTPVGSAFLTAGRFFRSSRKIFKIHQNVFIFYKGNPKNIKEKFTSIEFCDIDNELNIAYEDDDNE